MKALDVIYAWLRRSGWLLLIAFLQFALHLWVNAHDNFFRDELYYLAAGQHLDLGYVDYPPFVAFITAFARLVFGSSEVAIRLLPALAGAAMVLLTAAMVAELGGGLPAQCLAATAVALAPIFLGSSGLMTMDPFDQLWWTLAAFVLLRLIRRQEPRLWLAFGVVAGVGLLTKVTMSFYCFGLVVGLLLSPSRRLLFNRWLLMGGAIALLIFSPYLIWQVQHGFPTLEFWATYAAGKTYPVTPLEFLIQQVKTINPLALPLVLAGLYFLFFHPKGRPYQAFGWAYLILYVLFMIQKTKFYFLSPAYPVLFAAGAYTFELLVQARPRWTWLQPNYLRLLLITGVFLAPFAIPILRPDTFIQYNDLLGGIGDVRIEQMRLGDLPQTYADRYGWPEMTADIAQAYDSLTAEEKSAACILTMNYGEAGALDFYGPAYGLPKSISGHNSYFLWGPNGCSGKVVITVEYPFSDLAPSFESVQPAGEVECGYCMPYENRSPIFIARGLKAPIEAAWPTVKLYE